MISIIIEDKSNYKDVADFYRTVGYNPALEDHSTVVSARQESRVVGVVRVVEEQNILVLRGMQVAQSHQKQGLGSQMLEKLGEIIGNQACYCLPYPWLDKFYGQIGFETLQPEKAPPHLYLRWQEYQAKYPHPPILMRRPSSCENS